MKFVSALAIVVTAVGLSGKLSRGESGISLDLSGLPGDGTQKGANSSSGNGSTWGSSGMSGTSGSQTFPNPCPEPRSDPDGTGSCGSNGTNGNNIVDEHSTPRGMRRPSTSNGNNVFDAPEISHDDRSDEYVGGNYRASANNGGGEFAPYVPGKEDGSGLATYLYEKKNGKYGSYRQSKPEQDTLEVLKYLHLYRERVYILAVADLAHPYVRGVIVLSSDCSDKTPGLYEAGEEVCVKVLAYDRGNFVAERTGYRREISGEYFESWYPSSVGKAGKPNGPILRLEFLDTRFESGEGTLQANRIDRGKEVRVHYLPQRFWTLDVSENLRSLKPTVWNTIRLFRVRLFRDRVASSR